MFRWQLQPGMDIGRGDGSAVLTPSASPKAWVVVHAAVHDAALQYMAAARQDHESTRQVDVLALPTASSSV